MTSATRSAPTADLRPDPDAGARAIWVRRAFMSVLALIVLAAIFGFLGVRSRTVSTHSTNGAVTMDVHYAQFARAGLDVPFDITVHRRGGFQDDVVVAVSSSYLELFDRNAMDPDPSSATSTSDAVIWRFDPPPGDTFVMSIDMKVQNGRHFGKSGWAEVRESGRPVARATFKTWLAP
jgi:hypothetical protein